MKQNYNSVIKQQFICTKMGQEIIAAVFWCVSEAECLVLEQL